MTDAEKYVAVFRAAAKGVIAPYPALTPINQMLPTGSGVLSPGPSEAEERARSMAGAFNAIADVFQQVVDAEGK